MANISEGTCSLCNATFKKAAMTKHLQSCLQRTETTPDASAKKSRKGKIFHIVAEGHGIPGYWLHLEAPADATLADLDSFLRDIWLECCGHLSLFNIGGQTYTQESDAPDFMWAGEFNDESMDVELREVLGPGIKFSHEYDFGTTTYLTLKVVSEREGDVKGKSVRLLAQNNPLLIKCGSCGNRATQVCGQCIYSSDVAWVCDACAPDHECGEDMLLPVVNSPRVGMCGYAG